MPSGVSHTRVSGSAPFRSLEAEARQSSIVALATDPDAEGDISHFQALSAALSATIGTGNIAGVGTAVGGGTGVGGMGVRVGCVHPDGWEAVDLALRKGGYIVQEKVPLNLWGEEDPVLDPEGVPVVFAQCASRELGDPAAEVLSVEQGFLL